MKRSSPHRELSTWLDQHGYHHARAKKPAAHPYAVSLRGAYGAPSRLDHATRAEHLFTYRNKHGSWSNVWATDVEHAKRQISKRKDTPGSFFSISRVTNVPSREPRESTSLRGREPESHHARIIHQKPTGRPVFAAHERDHHITTSGRRALTREQFALPPGPEEKRRGIKGRLPIDTLKRGRNALNRAAQMKKRGHITAGQLAEAQRAVHREWPSIKSETRAHATMRRSSTNKADVVRSFNDLYPPETFRGASGHIDRPMRNEAWNNYTDALAKDGFITMKQYESWTHPWRD